MTTRRRLARVAVGSVVSFVLLYLLAALLFPGGTRAEPMRDGFTITGNYFCDLLDAHTYGGRPNPARWVALVGTAILCGGLACLWWSVPVLYPEARKSTVVVRASGVASGLVTPFIATRSVHDLAINLAGIFGIIAFAVTLVAIGRRGGTAITTASIGTLLLVLTNYFVWETHTGVAVLPSIQKLAFAAFLAWVVIVARRVDRGTLE
jgi:hypothetical protein